MYKNKYLKYKQKYSELKKTINHQTNQLGGMTLFPILMQFDQDRFEEWYKMKTNPLPDGDNKNSFQAYLDLFTMISPEQQIAIEPYNILVGTGCMNEPDYFRFKDSPTYSLYIDEFKVKEEAGKQYHMYTINYEDLRDNFLRLKQNSINQIHFDTGVSYFAPINYLELAEHVLIPGGKIIWDLLQRGGQVIFRRDNIFKKINGSNYSEEEIKELVNFHKVLINTVDKKIIPRDNSFYDLNTICPQIRLGVIEFLAGGNISRYKLESYIGFIEYCSKRFARLNFQKKTYTYANYTYPVPIRIYQNDSNFKINVYNEIVNFIVNDVMNLEEKTKYINTKKVSIEKIIQLCDRIKTSIDLKNKILEKNLISHEFLDLCKINDNPIEYDLSLILDEFIWNEFNIELEYIEATKK